MKSNITRVLIAVISLLTYGCFGQVNHCITKYRFFTYSYPVNNNENKYIGFTLIEGDESLGVKSIAIYPNSKYVILVDASYNNLKRIDMTNGDMISSKKITEYIGGENHTLIDVAVFNEKIYATTNSDILVFDSDLNYLSSIKVNSEVPNTIRFSKVTNDSVYIYLSHKQLNNKDIEVEQFVITKKSSFEEKIIIPIIKFTEDGKNQKTLGKEYSTNFHEGKTILNNKYGCYELKSSLPNNKYYGSRNIDFNDKVIVYFDSNPKQFTLFCYLVTSE